MALSFVASFFIGWAAGAGTLSLAVAVIALSLKWTKRGASAFAWLSNSQGASTIEASTKESDTAANLPSPPQVPEARSIQDQMMNPNPITEQHRRLSARVIAIVGPKGIDENVGFEFFIKHLALNLVYGGQDPAITPTIMPTIERSMFNDQELVRLAGEPPEGETWSELISDRDTRYYAVWTFLVRLLYKRMDPAHDVQECLLPPEVSSCYQLIPNRHYAQTEDFVSVWRETLFMLLMRLYNMVYKPATCFSSDGSDPRQERIDAMASEVADTLNMKLLDAAGRSEDEIKKRLGPIFERAANCALIFFGQPSEWEADWDSDPGRLVTPRIRFMWNGQVKWTRPPTIYPGTPWAPLRD
ncbi:hypothetical protein IL306_008157 [Fusarium sp. DS 682]|nr:hypothetical protein IL306_008157 [Fusarium sp. DS 682]